MKNTEVTALTRALSAALKSFGVDLSHQQSQHVLAAMLQEKNYHALAARLKGQRETKGMDPAACVAGLTAQGYAVTVLSPEDLKGCSAKEVSAAMQSAAGALINSILSEGHGIAPAQTEVCAHCGSEIVHDYCNDSSCPYSDWPQWVPYDDLVTLSQKDIAKKHGVKKRRPVSAEIHSDDRVYEVDFDAEAWFRKASDTEIMALAEIGWAGDYEADVVGEFFESTNPEIAELLEYCQKLSSISRQRIDKPPVGFEVSVDEQNAMRWLKSFRKGVWAQILCEENNVSLTQAEEPEIEGMWDWYDDQGNACARSFETIDEAAIDAVEFLGLGE